MMLIQSDRLESICDEILHLDSKMMFVVIINDNGRLLAKNKKEGTEEALVGQKEQEILLMEIALGVRMRRDHDHNLGEVKFTITHGDKVISMIFPLCESILYVCAEKEIDTLKASLSVLQLLETK
ncbi:MAG: DUF6659 family protein [Nitrosotalea sp.]